MLEGEHDESDTVRYDDTGKKLNITDAHDIIKTNNILN